MICRLHLWCTKRAWSLLQWKKVSVDKKVSCTWTILYYYPLKKKTFIFCGATHSTASYSIQIFEVKRWSPWYINLSIKVQQDFTVNFPFLSIFQVLAWAPFNYNCKELICSSHSKALKFLRQIKFQIQVSCVHSPISWIFVVGLMDSLYSLGNCTFKGVSPKEVSIQNVTFFLFPMT
jgi:hypothetical protein